MALQGQSFRFPQSFKCEQENYHLQFCLSIAVLLMAAPPMPILPASAKMGFMIQMQACLLARRACSPLGLLLPIQWLSSWILSLFSTTLPPEKTVHLPCNFVLLLRNLWILTVFVCCSFRSSSTDRPCWRPRLFWEGKAIKCFTNTMQSEILKLSNYCYYLGKQQHPARFILLIITG